MIPAPEAEPVDLVRKRTLRKVSRRILPFFFVLYIVSYLDRANVAFAKTAMMADLRFSEAVFGFGAGIFFVGYFLLEIPGALIVERWSARLWISRILVTWGLMTVLVGFVRTPFQFYAARFLLGLAEAGFFPGVIVYMTHWFPSRDRARAMAGFIVAVPLSLTLGAPISAMILRLDWLNLPGWRWVFILEGLPALILGVITIFYLTDRPAQAGWLTREERDWLVSELELEKRNKRASAHLTILQAFRQRNVIILALILFLVVVGMMGYLFWLPSTIEKASGLSSEQATALSAIPFAIGAVVVWLMGRSSDRLGERRLHTAIPMFLAGVFFLLTTIEGQPFPLTMLWLTLTGILLYAWSPSYWVLPTLTLTESAAAASIGLINSIGNLGGFVGPSIVGFLLSSEHTQRIAIPLLCASFFASSAMVFALRLGPRQRA